MQESGLTHPKSIMQQLGGWCMAPGKFLTLRLQQMDVYTFVSKQVSVLVRSNYEKMDDFD